MVLTEGEILEGLSGFKENGWEYKNGRIVKKHEFKDQTKTKEFFNLIYDFGRSIDHDPVISIIHPYVTVSLYTFCKKGITEKDFVLLGYIEEALKRYSL